MNLPEAEGTIELWEQFLEITDDLPQPKFHNSFPVGFFKLLLFRQEKGHWIVLSKDVTLYHRLKNQRVYMREYEEYSQRRKENPLMRSNQYYNLLKIHVGVQSYKSGSKETDN
jgi:hypothetical protein